MTKQQCLEELDFIMESTISQAVYLTACNYYDTVANMSDYDFSTVSDWYENAINNKFK